MKALRKLSFVASAAILVLFSGCFNISGGEVDTSKATVEQNGVSKKEITLTITNYDELLEEAGYTAGTSRSAAASNARTITSSSYAPTDLTYYITGTSSNGEDLVVSEVKPYSWDGNKGKVSLAVDSYTWDLKLYAVPTTDADAYLASGKTDAIAGTSASISADIEKVKKYAVLAGKTAIDMYYTTEAYFALTANGLDKDQYVNLTLKLGSDWENNKVPAGYSVTAGIYDMDNGSVINTSKDSTSTEMSVPVTGDNAISNTTGFAYTANTDSTSDPKVTIPTGTYNFVVTFKNDITNRTYVWSDVIIVIPGKGCTANVTIPNVIGKLPTAPENFRAAYISGSEDGVITDRYKVVFQWEDKANNESYFEIQMVDVESLRSDLTTKVSAAADAKTIWATNYTDATDTTKNAFASWAATTDVSWTDIDAYYDNTTKAGGHQYTYPDFVQRWGADIYATEEHAEGSLLANSKTVTMYLPLGTSYMARIRAVNDAGYSDAVKVTLDTALATSVTNAVLFDGGTNAYGTAANGTLYNSNGVSGPGAGAASGDRMWTTDDSTGKGVARTNAATTISRYRVRYNLQGGTYDPDGKGSKTPLSGSIVEYYCQDATTGNYILYPGATTKETLEPYMQCGTSFFSYWAMGLETISNDTVYPYDEGNSNEPDLYKDSGNLELYALYGAASVDVLYADKYPIDPTWVSYGYSATKGTAVDDDKFTALTATTAASTIEIVKTNADDTSNAVMSWKVTVPAANKYNFETVSVKLYKGNVIYYEETLDAAEIDASTSPVTDGKNLFDDMPLKKLPNGTYQLLIYATYGGSGENGIIVTLPLSLSVVDSASS